MTKILYTAVIAFVYILLIMKLGSIYLADVSYKEARVLLSKGKIAGSLGSINRAIEKNPSEPAYYRERARIYLASMPGYEEEDLSLIKNLALNDLKVAYDLNPNNIVTLRNSVPLYYFLAVEDVTRDIGPDNVDEDLVNETKAFYRHAKTKSPSDVGIYVLLAKYEHRLGMQEELEESIKRIRSLRPDLIDWHPSLKNIDVGF
jgi:tetratricopeptide (TPR) repeat protein